MADKLIFKAKTVFVQYAIIVNNDGTIEAAAKLRPADYTEYSISRIKLKYERD